MDYPNDNKSLELLAHEFSNLTDKWLGRITAGNRKFFKFFSKISTTCPQFRGECNWV